MHISTFQLESQQLAIDKEQKEVEERSAEVKEELHNLKPGSKLARDFVLAFYNIKEKIFQFLFTEMCKKSKVQARDLALVG